MKEEIKFLEESIPYVIRCKSDNYLICTRKLDRRRDADLLWDKVNSGAYHTFTRAYKELKDDVVYTIVDLKNNIRGPENLVFCMGFNTDSDCEEALLRLESGESEISYRNRVPLNIISK